MSNIKIKISEIMSNNIGLYNNENHILRISKELRQKLNVEIGQQFQLNSIKNNPVILQIGSAFKADKEQDSGVCYVTKSVFDVINVENTNNCKVEPVKGITLGCDPEFFLVDKDSKKILRAEAFFKKWGEIGYDGLLAEFRPKPALTPQELTNNIYDLIKNTREILNLNNIYDPSKIIMFASSCHDVGLPKSLLTGLPTQATAGFHLHFGLPKSILGHSPNIMSLMFKIVKMMDYYVGLPSIMLETEKDARRRSNTQVNYGKPSDFRLDNRTLEYRVPGGSMLRHPILTKGLISLGITVIEDIVSRIKLQTNNFKQLYWMEQDNRLKELYPNILNTTDMFSLMCSPDSNTIKTYFDNIYLDIQNMIGFEERKAELNDFFYHIANDIQYNNNLEKNWENFYEQGTNIHQSRNEDTTNSPTSKLLEIKS